MPVTGGNKHTCWMEESDLFFLGSGRSFSDFASYRLLRVLSALLQFYSTYLFVHFFKKTVYIYLFHWFQ